jgi:hypothetical protein
MSYLELTRIEAAFEIGGRGVLIMPDFPAPLQGWQNRSETVLIEITAGQEFEVEAQINLMHINGGALMAVEMRWRVAIFFPNRKESEFPIGSKIFVSPELRNELLARR